ncbi:MAG: sel1 repeat family protein [Campylobacteraceae bacterium]|jgi:TPR repeat protein|nr:sel1 repeat family protein [Campylobacteraceae bacterium]
MKIVFFIIVMVLFNGCFLYNENFNAGNAALKKGDTATAKEQFKIGCDSGGDKYSCYNYSYVTYQDKEYEKAIPYAKKACDLGNYKGCAALGHVYEMGEGVKQNYSEAVIYYEKACGELYESCERAANLYNNGLGVSKNPIKAQALIERACTESVYSRDAKKCYEFGTNRLNSGNTAKALNFFEKACEANYAQGCADAAVLYTKQTPKDYFKASALYKKGCSLNNAQSCYDFVALYADRKNPISDLTEVKELFQKTCTYSNRELCYKIALLYTDKRGGIYDMQEAKNFFKKACDFGLKDGCNAAARIK